MSFQFYFLKSQLSDPLFHPVFVSTLNQFLYLLPVGGEVVAISTSAGGSNTSATGLATKPANECYRGMKDDNWYIKN
jgi:hypothetical protein